MQKILRFVSLTTLTLFLSLQFSFAQTPAEALAGMRDEDALLDLPTPTKVENPTLAEEKKETPVQAFQKQFQAQNPKLAKKMEKAQRFLDSKVGKWVIKRAMAKAERKALRKAKKHPEQAQIAPDKLKETKKLSGNLRIAAILAIVGILWTLIVPGDLRWLGTILIVIALVLLLLELI